MTAQNRPTTCGDLYVTNPELAAKGCKRLPRHGGDHRSHLTQRGESRAARAKAAKAQVTQPRKAAVNGRKATVAQIKAAVKAAKIASGHERGRLSVTGRREVIAQITAMLDAGSITQSIALGAIVAL